VSTIQITVEDPTQDADFMNEVHKGGKGDETTEGSNTTSGSVYVGWESDDDVRRGGLQFDTLAYPRNIVEQVVLKVYNTYANDGLVVCVFTPTSSPNIGFGADFGRVLAAYNDASTRIAVVSSLSAEWNTIAIPLSKYQASNRYCIGLACKYDYDNSSAPASTKEIYLGKPGTDNEPHLELTLKEPSRTRWGISGNRRFARDWLTGTVDG